MANASDSDSEDWRFDPSRADQNRRKQYDFGGLFLFLYKEKACGARIAHRRCVILTKMPATNAGKTVKEKTEPGTRIASGLSLVDAKGVEPSTSAMRMQHSPN